MTSRTAKLIAVTMVGIAFASVSAVRTLAASEWDVTVYAAFGEEEGDTRSYAEERLGPVVLRPAQGHDGKFFFVQANDPWVLDPEENAAALDRPLYRSQRMLYPMLAGGFGVLGPEAITWAMLIVNILAMGAGTLAVAFVAMGMRGSPWWGLAFALNVGFISEMNIGGAGIVAAAAAFAAVAAVQRSKWALAFLFLTLAVLAREAMLIVAAGTAWYLWRVQGSPKRAWQAFGIPLGAVAAWALYLRIRIGLETGVSQIEEIGFPFVGFIQAFDAWQGDPFSMIVGVVTLVLLLAFAIRALASRHLVGLAFVGFSFLGVLFTEQVWHNSFDITRAVAPALTAYILLLFLGLSESSTPRLERTSVRG